MKRSPHSGILLVVMEEHHEAFYVWNYARQAGMLEDRGHTLLHVDAHADMMLPRFRRPLSSITDLADCADFVYHELDISTFIWPVVYMGLVNRWLWLKYTQRLSTGGWRSIRIAPKNAAETEFSISSGLSSDQRARWVDYCPVTTRDCLHMDQPLLLDIDLDYFCSNDYPDLVVREIEITPRAFAEFHSNPYHFLRISPLDKISAVFRDGKYYLVYNDYHPRRPSTEENLRTIEERLSDFISYLQRYAVVPELITVCRSRYSGYTPRDSIAFLQDSLIRRLRQLYSLEERYITEILPTGFNVEEGRTSPASAGHKDSPMAELRTAIPNPI